MGRAGKRQFGAQLAGVDHEYLALLGLLALEGEPLCILSHTVVVAPQEQQALTRVATHLHPIAQCEVPATTTPAGAGRCVLVATGCRREGVERGGGGTDSILVLLGKGMEDG